MERLPFGIARFDDMIGGGAPLGSSVLLATDIGAGGREFAYTCAVMNGLARTDQSRFERYYGSLGDPAHLPAEVHYLTFTAAASAIEREMSFAMTDTIVSAGLEGITFRDLAPEYFRRSQVPTDWYAEHAQELTALGSQRVTRDVYEAIGDYFETIPEGSLIVIDSISDLLALTGDEMDWPGVTLLLKGMDRVMHRRGGLLLLLANHETLSESQLGGLMETTDGTLAFEWAAGGTERDRTMFVRQFRGVLSRLEAEDIIRFETEITDTGFDISDVRKIR